MSQSVREIKQQRNDPTPPLNERGASMVGKVVAFAIYPDTLVAATISDGPRGDARQIDYRFTKHSKVRTEGPMDGGMLHFIDVPITSEIAGRNARHQDPCQRGDGPPLPAPQSGHFIPGTWFDPSPWLVSIECIRDPVQEVRAIPRVPGTLGRVLQAARDGERTVLGPFDDFTEACESARLNRERYDHVQLLFARRSA